MNTRIYNEAAQGHSANRKLGVLSLSVFFSLITVQMLFGDFDMRLDENSNFFISEATRYGISVGKRVSLFYKVLIVFALAVSLIYTAASRFLVFSRTPFSIVSALSVSGILLVLADFFGQDAEIAVKVILCLTITVLVLSYFKKSRRVIAAFPVLILLSLFSSSFFLLFGNSTRAVTAQLETIFLLNLAIWFLGYHFSLQKGVRPRYFYRVMTPLAFSPVLIFLGIEASFFFELNDGNAYKWITGIGLILLWILWWVYSSRLRDKKADWFIRKFYAPFCVVLIAVCIHYSPIVSQSEDLFELANPANALMRVFKFGEIPLLDFMSSHMLSEQYYGMIYSLIFGFSQDIGFTSFSFFYFILFYLLVYNFGLKLFGSWPYALLIVATLPFLELVFSIHLFFAILVFYGARAFVTNSSAKNTTYLILIVLAAICWRLDMGVAALLSVLFFVPLSFSISKSSLDRQGVFRGVLAAIGVVALLCVVAIGITSWSHFSSNFLSALHYVSANQAHGFASVAKKIDQDFIKIVYILPLFAVLALFILWKMSVKERSSSRAFSLEASIFFYLIFLTNFPRGLVRHGFIENNDVLYISTFVLATVLLILTRSKNSSQWLRYALFSVSSFVILIHVKHFDLPKGYSKMERLFVVSRLIDFEKEREASETRVIGKEDFAAKHYSDLCEFMSANLTADQTFLDFSNSPMLYFYCGREVPSYFCQSLQNTVDDFTQMNHLNRIDTSQVPYVIYSHSPPNWFDATDGIPNPMRYYLMADFIYQNYSPHSTINGYEVWKVKDALENASSSSSSDWSRANFEYGYVAESMAEYFKNNQFPTEEVAKSKIHEKRLVVPVDARRESKMLVRFDFEKVREGEKVKVQLIKDGNKIDAFNFKLREGQLSYLLPVSNIHAWHRISISELTVSLSKQSRIKHFSLIKDKRFEDQ